MIIVIFVTICASGATLPHVSVRPSVSGAVCCPTFIICVCFCRSAGDIVVSRAEEKSKRKDRSRSKSPFRSFRWKKSPKTSSGAVSDDEGAASAAQGIHGVHGDGGNDP